MCHKTLDDNAAFCKYCGSKQETVLIPPDEPQAADIPDVAPLPSDELQSTFMPKQQSGADVQSESDIQQSVDDIYKGLESVHQNNASKKPAAVNPRANTSNYAQPVRQDQDSKPKKKKGLGYIALFCVIVLAVIISSIGDLVGDSHNNDPSYSIKTEIKEYPVSPELGDDMLSGKFQLEGKVYQLPMSLKALLDDGWIIDSDEEKMIQPNDLTLVTLRKESCEVDVRVYNAGNNAIPVENSQIRGLTVFVYSNTSFIIPGNIKCGISKSELESSAANFISAAKLDDMGSSVCYALNTNDSSRYLMVNVDKESECVTWVSLDLYE